MHSPAPAEIKDSLRKEAFAQREALSRDFRVRASRWIAEHVLELAELAGVQPIGGYWPIRSEVDPRPLMRALIERGQSVALSQILHPRLSWRLWQPGDVLIKGGFGVREPGPDAPECFPRALLVPLAAFDRQGGRLGYGKGHFDRSIAGLLEHGPVLTIGLGYAAQEIDRVPVEPHDQPLHFIVTEAEIIRPSQG
jgi:5-formyltetrahydrofolate cyclo-ligase